MTRSSQIAATPGESVYPKGGGGADLRSMVAFVARRGHDGLSEGTLDGSGHEAQCRIELLRPRLHSRSRGWGRPDPDGFLHAGAGNSDLSPHDLWLRNLWLSGLEPCDVRDRDGQDRPAGHRFNGTSLIRAAERGHSLVVGRLLQTRTRVNHVNRLRYTALHEAIILGRSTPSYADTVRLLVARGADVTLPAGTAGTAPLEAASDRAYPPLIATLEAALAAKPVAASAASAALLAAATSGDADAAAIALRQGADLESGDRLGRTPLILAVTHGRPEVARLLVALGADPDTQDARQDSP
jgi:Ankyrin repeats (3 copies)